MFSRGHARLVEEDAAEVVPVGEHLVLEREERAARVHQVDAREAVLRRHLLRAQVLLHRQRVVRAALDGRVVGDDHALPALDDADPGDDPRGRRVAVVEVPGGERVQLEERGAGIAEPVDPLAREKLPPGVVPLDRLGPAAGRDLVGALAQLGDERLHALPVRLEVLACPVDPRLENHGVTLRLRHYEMRSGPRGLLTETVWRLHAGVVWFGVTGEPIKGEARAKDHPPPRAHRRSVRLRHDGSRSIHRGHSRRRHARRNRQTRQHHRQGRQRHGDGQGGERRRARPERKRLTFGRRRERLPLRRPRQRRSRRRPGERLHLHGLRNRHRGRGRRRRHRVRTRRRSRGRPDRLRRRLRPRLHPVGRRGRELRARSGPSPDTPSRTAAATRRARAATTRSPARKAATSSSPWAATTR